LTGDAIAQNNGGKDFMQSFDADADARVGETVGRFHSWTVSGPFESTFTPGTEVWWLVLRSPYLAPLVSVRFLILLVGQHADTIIPEPDPASCLLPFPSG
jgi:hypothetical protein